MQILINCFIVCFLFLVIAWNSPAGSILKRMIQPFSPFILWAGLWQSWSMFAPEPILVNRRLYIELTFADGSVKQEELYRIHEADVITAFLNVRDRRYQFELANKNESIHRPAICRYFSDRYDEAELKLKKCQLIMLKRYIRKFNTEKENEVERFVLWTINK
ncbi:MAG: hypothetical protein AAFN77_14225 [Planctomycetota bacterium]